MATGGLSAVGAPGSEGWVGDTHYVPLSNLRLSLQRAMTRLAVALRHRSVLYLPLAAVGGSVLALASFACNLMALRPTATPPRRGYCSSVFTVLRGAPGKQLTGPQQEIVAARAGLSSRPQDERGMAPSNRSGAGAFARAS
jgi:hypothetical protein